MDMDPGILCFQHCGPKVFCFQLPNDCPVCTCNLSNGNFQLPPFRVPYPFVRAIQHPCSIVIKPTTGDFLHDYRNTKDLHIGVTTSQGEVVEFDRRGVRRNQAALWQQCLVVDGAAKPWSEHWDATLQQVSGQPCWTPFSYDEDSFNCYTFVLSFLCKLRYGNLSEAAMNRTVFCESFILPRTTAAGKYISLFRKLQASRFYIYKPVSSDSFRRGS
ncbi:MKRN2 opposite strand protein [Bacillus rossius redtenbacheri]|uniref:MKRN2 opposite strand protein n=1 Tax=Bacillus rossius redtenbacheri TaxID=93214 RepID=UPI002FDE2ACE